MNQFQKRPPIKSPKTLALVNGQPCYLQYEGICQSRDETVVPCHSPFREDNQGWSQKSHDFLAVPGCMECHNFLDGRTHKDFPQDAKRKDYHIALKRWLEYLLRAGALEIK